MSYHNRVVVRRCVPTNQLLYLNTDVADIQIFGAAGPKLEFACSDYDNQTTIYLTDDNLELLIGMLTMVHEVRKGRVLETEQ